MKEIQHEVSKKCKQLDYEENWKKQVAELQQLNIDNSIVVIVIKTV